MGDKTVNDELHEGLTGKNEEIANAIRAATETHLYAKKNLGLTLREIHLDQWSITEVLRLHLESSGACRGVNLQNWRYQQRGGWRLQDDPGFRFCLENPQILASLQDKSIFDLGVTDKIKLLTVMMNQMLSFAGVRDEIESMNEDLALKKAKEIMEAKQEAIPASPSSDKENKSSLELNTGSNLAVGEVGKTYSKKPPVLKQKILGSSNGSLSVNKIDEVKQAESSNVNTEVSEESTTKVFPDQPPWGTCLATGVDCPVHSNILPRAHWSFYSTVEEIDDLLEGLNPRGVREGDLKDKLSSERERIINRVKKVKVDQLVVSEDDIERLEKEQLQKVQDRRDKASKYAGVDTVPMGTHLQDVIELSLRDQILELEEKLWVGGLGNLKVSSRDKWTTAISDKKYDMGAESLVWGEGDKLDKEW